MSPIQFKGYQELFFILISFFNKMFVSKQNSPRFAASHLDLFCLPMSHKKDARLVIWVKYFNQNPACYHVCVKIEHRPIIRPRLCSQLTTCTIHINIGISIFQSCTRCCPITLESDAIGFQGYLWSEYKCFYSMVV